MIAPWFWCIHFVAGAYQVPRIIRTLHPSMVQSTAPDTRLGTLEGCHVDSPSPAPQIEAAVMEDCCRTYSSDRDISSRCTSNLSGCCQWGGRPPPLQSISVLLVGIQIKNMYRTLHVAALLDIVISIDWCSRLKLAAVNDNKTGWCCR